MILYLNLEIWFYQSTLKKRLTPLELETVMILNCWCLRLISEEEEYWFKDCCALCSLPQIWARVFHRLNYQFLPWVLRVSIQYLIAGYAPIDRLYAFEFLRLNHWTTLFYHQYLFIIPIYIYILKYYNYSLFF